MNILLINPSDVANNLAYVSGRQLAQLLTVHNSAVGDSVRVGMVDGQMGNGRVLSIDAKHATLEVVFNLAPPSPLPLTLILALPRPKMLRRTLQTVATMGVKQLYLINSFRVEKSYLQSPPWPLRPLRKIFGWDWSRRAIRFCLSCMCENALNHLSKTNCLRL